jgi:DNA phosphorothioation-dependent restriction protein DptG
MEKEFRKKYLDIDYSNQNILKLHNNRTIPNSTLPLFHPIDKETAISYAKDLQDLGHKDLAKLILDVL